MAQFAPLHTTAARGRHGGFTILEIVAALGVMSVATFIAISLYGASYAIGENSRATRIAASLAEERLTDMRIHPGSYIWPEELVPGKPERVVDEAGNVVIDFDRPAVMPADARSGRRERDFYSRFLWKAFAEVTKPEDNHIIVTVVILWEDGGHNRNFTLTSALPRSVMVGGAR